MRVLPRPVTITAEKTYIIDLHSEGEVAPDVDGTLALLAKQNIADKCQELGTIDFNEQAAMADSTKYPNRPFKSEITINKFEVSQYTKTADGIYLCHENCTNEYRYFRS